MTTILPDTLVADKTTARRPQAAEQGQDQSASGEFAGMVRAAPAATKQVAATGQGCAAADGDDKLQEIEIPGVDGATRRRLLAALKDDISALADKTRKALEAAGAGNGAALNAIFEKAAAELGTLLAGFDAAHGANAVETLAGNAAQAGIDLSMLAGDGAPGQRLAAFFSAVRGALGLGGEPNATAAAAATGRDEMPPQAWATDATQRPASPETQTAQVVPPRPTPETAVQKPADPTVTASPDLDVAAAGQNRGSQAAASVEGDAIAAVDGGGAADVAKKGGGQDTMLRQIVQQTLPSAGQPQHAQPLPRGDVAQANPSQPAPTATPMHRPDAPVPTQVADGLRRAEFVNGQTRVTLSPEGLGDLEIDIQPSESGKLRIVLRADHAHVLHAIRSERDILADALQSRGIDAGGADLEFETFGGRGQNRGADETGFLGAQPDDEAGEPESVTAQTPTTPRLSGAGRVDIFT